MRRIGAGEADQGFFDDVTASLDRGMETDGQTAIARGYGTLEFGLLRTAVAGGRNTAMHAMLREALRKAAPSSVTANMEAYLDDFLDANRPSLAYRKMKANSSDNGIDPQDWRATWRTNSYFKNAKSEFAFHLYEALADMPTDEAARTFTVPQYIRDAIAYVTGSTNPHATQAAH